MIKSRLGFSGEITKMKVTHPPKAPLSWRLRNWSRRDFICGTIANWLAKKFSKVTGIITITGELSCILANPDGSLVNYGVVSRRVVTTAFAEFMVDQLQAETSQWGDFKFHDSGVGVTAAAVGDTDIQTTDGESRVAGNQIEGATAEIYKSVATITYTTTKAITEHGIFSQATGSTLMDRSVFAALNVVATNQIQFSYELTVVSGG